MKIKICGQEIPLRDTEVIIARKAVRNLVEVVRKAANEKNAPSMYFTLLIMMYKHAEEVLTALTPEALQVFMTMVNRDDILRHAQMESANEIDKFAEELEKISPEAKES